MLIIKSQIKELVRQNAAKVDNVSSDFPDKLHQKVLHMINEACTRAENNGRRTVMGKDL